MAHNSLKILPSCVGQPVESHTHTHPFFYDPPLMYLSPYGVFLTPWCIPNPMTVTGPCCVSTPMLHF